MEAVLAKADDVIGAYRALMLEAEEVIQAQSSSVPIGTASSAAATILLVIPIEESPEHFISLFQC